MGSLFLYFCQERFTIVFYVLIGKSLIILYPFLLNFIVHSFYTEIWKKNVSFMCPFCWVNNKYCELDFIRTFI